MAYLAIRGSGAVNGVSRLHGKVSRQLFLPLFPRWPEDEVPIGYVTNGVHMPTWDSAQADDLWTESCGKERWLGTTKNLGQDIAMSPTPDSGNFEAPPASLWWSMLASDCRVSWLPPAGRPKRSKPQNITSIPTR